MDHVDKAKVRSAVGLTVGAAGLWMRSMRLGLFGCRPRPLHVPYVTT